ncbi:MAG: hypothetical protein QXH21_09245 [Ignisphaera sp.]
MADMRKNIISTGSYELYVEIDKEIKITKVWYPIYPHGNYVKDVIEIDTDNKRVAYYTVKNSWNGTGRDDHGHVQLNDNELSDVIEIVKNVKSLDDFNKLIDKFNEMLSDREKKIVEMYEKLTDELIMLISADERLRRLESSDIKQFVKECIDNYLADD